MYKELSLTPAPSLQKQMDSFATAGCIITTACHDDSR